MQNAFVIAALILGLACSHKESALKLTSSAFVGGASIPRQYTCDGGEAVPPLAFEGAPAKTASLALIVDDPDAPSGSWDHWVVWNIAPDAHGIEGVVGRNGWGRNAWGGPCPPSGEHRYVFRLYALDQKLDLPPSAGKRELQEAMTGHVLGEAQLVGRYRRV